MTFFPPVLNVTVFKRHSREREHIALLLAYLFKIGCCSWPEIPLQAWTLANKHCKQALGQPLLYPPRFFSVVLGEWTFFFLFSSSEKNLTSFASNFFSSLFLLFFGVIL